MGDGGWRCGTFWAFWTLGGGGDPFEVQRVLATGGRQVVGLQASEARSILVELDFGGIPGLSREMVDKFRRLRPVTKGEASRILGVTPAAGSGLDM